MNPKRVYNYTNAVIVPPFPAYLPKVRSTAEGHDRYSPITVKKLAGVESTELLLCTARTLIYYHEWASKKAPGRSRFFISNKSNASSACLSTVSSGAKKLIRSAYSHSADDPEALALAQARRNTRFGP